MARKAKPAPASADGRPWFDPDQLRELAGGRSFRNGEDYFRRGAVTLLDLGPARVLGAVAGTEEYRTELSLGRAGIAGTCTCRAFEDYGSCKHLVALGLAANAAEGQPGEVGPFSAIRTHLEGLATPALVAMIIDLAERDPQLRQRLELAATLGGGDDKAVESRLRKAITAATRTGGFVSYYEASNWVAGVADVLVALEDVARSRPALDLGLASHAIQRTEHAIENIDDSDGHCTDLMQQALKIHRDACQTAKPDAVALARELFGREMDDGYGFFEGSCATYADALGEAGLAEYRRLAEEAWKKLSPAGRLAERPDRYGVLAAILDFFAERDGDVEARIALRAKDLSSQWNYLELARFCLEHGRKDEALRRAEEGLWVFEDEQPDERLVVFVAGLLLEAGRRPEAVEHLWRLFEKRPSVEAYRRLCAAGGGQAKDRALAYLERTITGEAAARWYQPADLLLRILTLEQRFDDAWELARAHVTSIAAREALARVSEATHPARAIETYAERIEGLVRSGTNGGYADAAALVARMAKLRGSMEQASYVAGLKARHGRKRNFMKLLT